MTETDTQSRNQRSILHRCAMPVAAVLCVCALVAGIGLTWSAYTGGAFLKGVEVTKATQSLFASDMLVGYYSEPTSLDTRTVVVNTDGETCSFTFRIYNCLLDDQQVVNDKDVPYTLKVEADGVADSAWSISPAAGSENLPGLVPTIKTYTITFPKSALGSASFTVKAAVNAGSSQSAIGTKLSCLAAKIVPNAPSSVEAASVTGGLVDKAGAFADYDAYNYRITVTGIKTKVKLTWDSGVVELDPYFSQRHSSVEMGTGTAAFEMEPGSTVVNFFKVGNPSSWESLNINVEKAE